MNDFVTPPGMPEGWTPPVYTGDIVIPHEGIENMGVLVDMIYAQRLVREQDPASVVALADTLKEIWENFDQRRTNRRQFLEALANFKSTDLVNTAADDVTVATVEGVIVRMMDYTVGKND